MVRARTGNIAAPIGLHAGWVAVIYVVRETSERRADGPGAWLLSDYDGFIGWMVLGWTLVIGAVLAWWYRKTETGAEVLADDVGVIALNPAGCLFGHDGQQHVEPFEGVVELEQRLLVGELDGQQFGEPRPDPRGIVEFFLHVFVMFGEVLERAAHRAGQPRVVRRQRQLWLRGQPRDLTHVEPIARRATRAARGTCARRRS